MRGRSPHNKPNVRKQDLYRLLLENRGELRWRDLKEKVRETLRWGPTTLKKTLDQMIEDKLVIKEARLGKRSAEVWYRTMTSNDLLNAIRRENMDENIFRQWAIIVREKAHKLNGIEKEVFLRDNLHRIVLGSMLVSAVQFMLSLRSAKVNKLKETEILQSFDYEFDYLVKHSNKLVLPLLLEYSEYSLEIVDQILRESYQPPTVQSRSSKTIIEHMSSPSQWVNFTMQTDDRSEKIV